MKQSLCDLSITFAANVIRLFDNIHNRPNIKNQLLRSSSSVGANIHEAQYGYSTEDFVYKLQLALKECNESLYWIKLLKESDTITDHQAQDLLNLCMKLRYMLVHSINTTKQNSGKY